MSPNKIQQDQAAPSNLADRLGEAHERDSGDFGEQLDGWQP